jgi:hypothetical protein
MRRPSTRRMPPMARVVRSLLTSIGHTLHAPQPRAHCAPSREREAARAHVAPSREREAEPRRIERGGGADALPRRRRIEFGVRAGRSDGRVFEPQLPHGVANGGERGVGGEHTRLARGLGTEHPLRVGLALLALRAHAHRHGQQGDTTWAKRRQLGVGRKVRARAAALIGMPRTGDDPRKWMLNSIGMSSCEGT